MTSTRDTEMERQMRRLLRMIDRVGQTQARLLREQEEIREEMRLQTYGTPTHAVRAGESHMHVMHPLCWCDPLKRERHDGPTLWMHRSVMN